MNPRSVTFGAADLTEDAHAVLDVWGGGRGRHGPA